MTVTGTQRQMTDNDPSTETAPGTGPGETAHRLTLRAIAIDLLTRFFSLERGWLCTVKELFTEPGPMIRRYVEGERLLYANPFAYLLVATAISVVIQKSVGFQDWMVEGTLANPQLRPAQAELIAQMQHFIFAHLLYVTLGILIPFTLCMRLFFRRSGYNLAEMFVFALYTSGHTSLFAVIFLPLTRYFEFNPMLAGVPVLLIYMGYAAVGFFGGRVWTVVRTWVAYGLGFFCYMAFVMTMVLIYLLTFGLSSFKDPGEWNLVVASEQGLTAVVQSLIVEGADVDMTLRRTALHAAAGRGDLDIIDLLLAAGADLEARDHEGRTPLFLALRGGHGEAARRLLDAGADAALVSDAGDTALLEAARSEDEALVRRLLEGGSPVNAVRPEGRRVTALMRAADQGHSPVVRLLLEHGADPAIANGEGETALDFADSDEISRLLREALADRGTDEGPPR